MNAQSTNGPQKFDSRGRVNNRILDNKTCIGCGRSFHPSHRTSNYCSRPCILAKTRVSNTTNSLYEQLRRQCSYDPETGVFTLRIGRGAYKPGHQYSYANANGYLEIGLNGRVYAAHRLAWLYMTASFPSQFIDHINGVKTDNRWSNLREADQVINQQNRRKAKANNSTGLIGVRHRVRRNKDEWTAQIYVDGCHKHLGSFCSPELAHIAYVKAKREMHPGGTL